MQSVTKENFKTFLSSAEDLAVLDYWADWCGPCRMLSQTVEELAEENPQIAFGKVNVDEEGELAMQAKIESIPALIVYREGEEIERFVGWRPKEELQALLEALL